MQKAKQVFRKSVNISHVRMYVLLWIGLCVTNGGEFHSISSYFAYCFFNLFLKLPAGSATAFTEQQQKILLAYSMNFILSFHWFFRCARMCGGKRLFGCLVWIVCLQRHILECSGEQQKKTNADRSIYMPVDWAPERKRHSFESESNLLRGKNQ